MILTDLAVTVTKCFMKFVNVLSVTMLVSNKHLGACNSGPEEDFWTYRISNNAQTMLSRRFSFYAI